VDKGNTFVMAYEIDYINKTDLFINYNQFEVLCSNSIKKVQIQVWQALCDNKSIINKDTT
jgi:hypothetical protein